MHSSPSSGRERDAGSSDGAVAVLGAGLGGLIAATFLARAGRGVHVYEALSRPGGRFADLDHDGFRLSTGALHIIPHGPEGPLMRSLSALGVSPQTVAPADNFFRCSDGDRTLGQLRGGFPAGDIARVLGALAFPSLAASEEESIAGWFDRHAVAESIRGAAFAVGGFALGVALEDLPAREVFRVIRRTLSLRGPLFLARGCGSVIDGLAAAAESAGARLHRQVRVEGIRIDRGRCAAIQAGGIEQKCGAVVSTLGPGETVRLAGEEAFPPEYQSAVRSIRPALGLKISVAADEPLVPFRGILFTPLARRLTGIVDLTQVDPSFAPPGNHVAMAYFVVRKEDEAPGRRDRLLEEAVQELREWLPAFAGSGRILAVQTFPRRWPVNRAVLGKTLPGATPIPNLHLAGDAVNPPGWMMAEGVAVSALRAAAAVDPNSVPQDSGCRPFLTD